MILYFVTVYIFYVCEGNAVTTIKSNDNVKVMTVRATAFEPAAEGSGAASKEDGKTLPESE